MKKVLIVTTVSGFVPQFEMNNVHILQSMGYEVHYATNYNTPVYNNSNEKLDNTGIIKHQIDFVRSPFQIHNNLIAYKQLIKLMDYEKYNLVHCHTPMGGVLGRLAAQASKTSPVIYTAHGFHFFKGSSIISWLLFYPVERLLAHCTDILITINKEDYKRAEKFKLRKNGALEKVDGVGIIIDKMNTFVSREDFKDSIGIPKESFIITSVGELTKRKNHKVVLKVLAKYEFSIPIVYVICGTGSYIYNLERLVKQSNIKDKVWLLGYRQDIKDILNITDCFVFPSLQEGLPVALMEAMEAGLPVVCSKIRGNTDLIDNLKGGLLVRPKSSQEFAHAIDYLISNELLRRKMGVYNKNVIEKYTLESIDKKMREIYKRVDNNIMQIKVSDKS